eukprot:7141030-Alexandrium_andersonii.AAC.1
MPVDSTLYKAIGRCFILTVRTRCATGCGRLRREARPQRTSSSLECSVSARPVPETSRRAP